MTLVDSRIESLMESDHSEIVTGTAGNQSKPPQPENAPKAINVGQGERTLSVASGAILALLGLRRRSVPGLLAAGVGSALMYRGVTGHCSTYQALHVNTARKNSEGLEEELDEKGIHVEQAFLINRSADELYQYWRKFENLPEIMTHLKEVHTIDDRRSHWVAKAPAIVGGQVAWDAEITQDEPGKVIAWRSLPGSQIDCAGEVRFSKALGDRGTEVHVYMNYIPTGGRVGHWIATVFGKAPRRQMHEDLRRFKQLMETGEIPTIVGQPKGSCTGQGGLREPPEE